MTTTATRIAESVKSVEQAHIPQLVTLQVLAKRWDLPISWLFHHTRAGASDPLPVVRLGKYVRVDLADPRLADWLNRRRTGR